MEIEFSRAQLKVLSAIFSNFAVVWIVALFTTRDPVLLTINVMLAIVSWHLAVKAELLIEVYD